MKRSSIFFVVLLATFFSMAVRPTFVDGQWKARYPKVDGYNHHVYLEGYELPFLTNGPIDPAPSPDGDRLAFSARGWIWVMDIETSSARRLTMGRDMDFRPAWSPDGQMLAFVRDNDHDTSIMFIDSHSGAEMGQVDSPALELDPAFSADGTLLFYSSAEEGDLDLWAINIANDEKRRVTSDAGIELRPQPGANSLVYLKKGSGIPDQVLLRLPGVDTPQILIQGEIASMARPALSPDESTIALNWPTQDGWELRLLNIDDPRPSILLASGGLPLTPAWSANGEWIYFSEADEHERMRLKRVRGTGGPIEDVPILGWEWGEPMSTVRIRTVFESGGVPVPTRLNVLDVRGHPIIPAETAARFDGQSGRVFFYSPGIIELSVPGRVVTVSAVQGLATPEVSESVELGPQRVTELEIVLSPLWDARAAGWTSGEHHFHLNYGGLYDLSPSDIVPVMKGEALDLATPLLANLHNRFEDQDLWRWQKSDQAPLIRFGQEVRAHFLGHIGLIGIDELFWPWVWGPGYEVYGSDDRENAEALSHARSQGGLGYYVHPVSPNRPEEASPWAELPFAELMPNVPLEIVADAVLGDLDALEVVCLWSDEVSTAQLWHRFLNLGIPVAPSAGTDVMTDFYRTMAPGTARVYAQTGNALNWPTYLDALRHGRSFVTNGPFIDFRIGGRAPGDVISAGPAEWELDLLTASGVDQVDLIVNGEIVWSESGIESPGSRKYQGEIELPEGGWVAIRALGGEASWPSMANYPFAHTGPVWIEAIGSTDQRARTAAAQELLQVLALGEGRLIQGYRDADIPNLRARFAKARSRLEALVVP